MYSQPCARLKQIADELRGIPVVDEFPEDHLRIAGQLLREAISLGVFCSATYAKLRVLVNRPEPSDTLAPLRQLSKRWWTMDSDISAWDDAVHTLLPDLGRQIDQDDAPRFELWFRACRKIADLIDFQIAEISNVPPPPAKTEQGEGNGGSVSQPAVESEANKTTILAKLQPAVRKAYLSFEYAESKVGKKLEDHEAHEWLNENGIDTDKGDMGELADYELPPNYDTWRRQVSEARRLLGEQKYTSRTGRPTGRSIVSGRKIEYQNGNDK